MKSVLLPCCILLPSIFTQYFWKITSPCKFGTQTWNFLLNSSFPLANGFIKRTNEKKVPTLIGATSRVLIYCLNKMYFKMLSYVHIWSTITYFWCSYHANLETSCSVSLETENSSFQRPLQFWPLLDKTVGQIVITVNVIDFPLFLHTVY